jgi:methionyl-tRNA formyltransferase
VRVVVLTQVPEVAALYADVLPGLGHEIAAVIVGRPFNGAPERFLAPAGNADVLFAASRRSLAPLLRAYAPDIGLCTGFPWRVPQEALDVPRLGIVNSHPTLLPKGRGPHPWAWAVRTGETELGVTFHYMDATFDTGNVLAQMPVAFAEDETHETLGPKLDAATRALLPDVFAKLEAGEPGVPQGDGEYQAPFEPEYAVVDTTRAAAEVHRQVRAWGWVPPRWRVGPVLGGERLLLTSLTEVGGARRVECADGPLWILETEPA